MRQAEQSRKTPETDVFVRLDLDGEGKADISTGIGFLDQMLVLLARHSRINLTERASGDLSTGDHHTVEDIGLVLGQAISDALGDKRGICRYGEARIPMDEALAEAVLDLSGRPFLVFSTAFTPNGAGLFQPP